jgi:peptide/nickel transport system permease protein
MGRIIVWRLIQLVVVSLILATVLFFAMRATGDPVSFILGSDATNEQIEEVRHSMGLDRPLYKQYFSFIKGLFPHRSEGSWKFLDFGDSIASRVPAMPVVLDRLPATLALGATAMAMAAIISLPLGIIATLQRGKFLGTVVMVLALLGQAVPNFLLALVFILVFGVTFRIFPVFDFTGVSSLVLPATALSAFTLARQVRLLRSQLMEVEAQDYVRTARAKGLSEARVIIRHQLPNALIPWITMLGMDIGYLLGGSIILETIFAWPGIGSLLILSINFRDYPMVQSIVFVIGVIVILGNLATDVVYRWLDPRIRYIG